MNSDLQLSKHHLVIIFASCRHLEEDWSFMCVGLHIRLVGSGAMLYPKSQHQNFLNLVGQLFNGKPNILWSADGAKTGIIDEITKT